MFMPAPPACSTPPNLLSSTPSQGDCMPGLRRDCCKQPPFLRLGNNDRGRGHIYIRDVAMSMSGCGHGHPNVKSKSTSLILSVHESYMINQHNFYPRKLVDTQFNSKNCYLRPENAVLLLFYPGWLWFTTACQMHIFSEICRGKSSKLPSKNCLVRGIQENSRLSPRQQW